MVISLIYIGIKKYEGEGIGLFDTVISVKECEGEVCGGDVLINNSN